MYCKLVFEEQQYITHAREREGKRENTKYCRLDATILANSNSRAPAATPNKTDDRLRFLICNVLCDMRAGEV